MKLFSDRFGVTGFEGSRCFILADSGSSRPRYRQRWGRITSETLCRPHVSWEGRGDGERTQQPELRIPAAGRRMAMMGMDRGQIASGPAAAARAAPSKLPQKPTPSKQRP